MAGLMGVTAFLSLWINNSGATSIMIPAAVAIIDELQLHEQQRSLVRMNGKRRKSKDIVPLESTGTNLFNLII
jgi:di/tricarboxylate transporter